MNSTTYCMNISLHRYGLISNLFTVSILLIYSDSHHILSLTPWHCRLKLLMPQSPRPRAHSVTYLKKWAFIAYVVWMGVYRFPSDCQQSLATVWWIYICLQHGFWLVSRPVWGFSLHMYSHHENVSFSFATINNMTVSQELAGYTLLPKAFTHPSKSLNSGVLITSMPTDL